MSGTSPAPRGAALVAAVDLGGTKADVALAGADGSLVSRRIPTFAERGAADVLARVGATLDELAGGEPLGAIGIGVPGVVVDGVVSLAPNIPGLDGLDVGAAIGERFPSARVGVINDLNAAATGELVGGALAGAHTALIVGLGTGIAAGVIVDGVLREGALGAAGEIGTARVPLLEAEGAAAGPGPRLEEFAGGRAFDVLAARHGLAGARELLDLAATERRIADLVDPRLRALAAVVGVCCHLLSPERVAFFGGLAAHPRVRAAIADPDAGLPAHVDLHWAAAADNAALRGALQHARDLLAD